jgi:hypothetical protein
MSQTISVSDAVADVASMIKSGNPKQAKRTTAQLLDNVHPTVLTLLNECADILSRPNAVARPKLSALWHRCDETGRKIIEACAPAKDEWEHRRVPELPADNQPRRTDRPASPAQTRRGTPVNEWELRARRDKRQARKDTAAYHDPDTGRAGVDDEPWRGKDRPDAYALDYDKAALHALRGLDCVSCYSERTPTDHAPHVREGDLSDDGLCTECRDRDREGIPSLPAGFAFADPFAQAALHVAARCTYVASRHHPATARTLLNRDWEAVPGHARALIAAWGKANTAMVEAPAQGNQAPDVDACGCGSVRQVRDGLCVECRQLDTDTDKPTGQPAEESAEAPAEDDLYQHCFECERSYATEAELINAWNAGRGEAVPAATSGKDITSCPECMHDFLCPPDEPTEEPAPATAA